MKRLRAHLLEIQLPSTAVKTAPGRTRDMRAIRNRREMRTAQEPQCNTMRIGQAINSLSYPWDGITPLKH